MPTSRDFAQAHAFRRRRLVGALVTGSVRDDGPRTGRVLIGGLLLAVLLLGGGVAAGHVLGRPPIDWLSAGHLVVSSDTGQAYVVLGEEPALHRVPDPTSARLALGDADPTTHVVADEHLRDAPLGDDLGIAGAPLGLPTAEGLRGAGWTACTAAASGTRVAVRPVPDLTAVDAGVLPVRSEGRLWLVVDPGEASALRLEIVADPTRAATLLGRWGFTGDPVEVDPAWLALVPRGPALALASFGLRGVGEPAAYDAGGGDLSAYRVGDLLRTPGGATYLLADEGPQRLLSPVAIAVWSTLRGEPIPVGSGRIVDYDRPDHPETWPVEMPTALPGDQPCALLEPGADGESVVGLGVDPGQHAAADGVAVGERSVEVEPSTGALVRVAGDDGPQLVVPGGTRHRLVGDDVAALLGLGDVTPVPVPRAWLRLVESGVALSTEAARR